MLEVFIVTLPFYVIGLVGGAFAAKPIGPALASGHAIPVTSDLIWTMVWYGLGSILILAVSTLGAACARSPQPSDAAADRAAVGTMQMPTRPSTGHALPLMVVNKNASCGCCITGPIRSRSVTCSRPCSTA